MSRTATADPAANDTILSASGGQAASLLGQRSWALFEWARNPYVLLITIYVFAPYFSGKLVGDPVAGQALWGDLSGMSGLIIAILAPFLGAIADLGGRRKPWIAGFALLLAVFTFSLWFAMPGGVMLPLWAVGMFIVLNNVLFEFTAVFHNAMLPDICSHRRVGALSGLGLALGNLAGVLMLLFMLWAFALPGLVDWSFIPSAPLFGLDRAAFQTERVSGPIAAMWLFVFALPLLLFTPDRAASGLPLGKAVTRGIARVVKTLRDVLHYRNVATYLAARMFYNDGKTAILTFGGIYAAGTFGWGPLEMLAYGVILSVFAVAGGILGGWLDDNLGSQKAILVSIGGTAIGLVLSLLMGPNTVLGIWTWAPENVPILHHGPFFKKLPEAIYVAIVIITAIFITAAYANSRTMLARIAPPEKMAEFFGLYALSGTATAFMAPIVVGAFTRGFGSQAAGMASILIFLGIGLVLMLFVTNERATAKD
ncbi:MAG: MFS transporter [Burkholderiaceae bacterium]